MTLQEVLSKQSGFFSVKNLKNKSIWWTLFVSEEFFSLKHQLGFLWNAKKSDLKIIGIGPDYAGHFFATISIRSHDRSLETRLDLPVDGWEFEQKV